MTKTITVHHVMHDTDGQGPTGDGTVIARFRLAKDAEAFAKINTCYGRPAKVQVDQVPRRIAERWGII
jgi:hypothetical protein